MPISADNIRALHKYDIRVLLGLERLMKRHEWIPLDVLKKAVRLSDGELDYRLRRLIAMDLVRFDRVPYEGYCIVFNGYDTLALHSLSTRGTVHSLGCLLGEGKESVVYEAMGMGPLVLKFHRVGQRSFRSVRLQRGYMPEGGHCPWIFASNLSAKKEFEALTLLHPRVRVPVPVDQNRHVVVESFVHGVNLNRADLDEPGDVFREILENVAESYRLGIIHADLSEFNIMISEGRPWLIDWPQWIGTDHPNAGEILMRDVGNVVRYFARKYSLRIDTGDAMKQVMG